MPRNFAFMIFHVSDLHFAEELYPSWTRSGAPVVPKTPPWRARLSLSQGVFPHDVAACEELENETKALIRDEKPQRALLVASGDLTLTGDDSEFVMALTYLRGRLQRDWSGVLGIGPYIRETFTVPGNHDHWYSSTMRGFRNPTRGISPIHGTYFRGPVGHSWWHESLEEGSIQLQLMGIDSRDPASGSLAARGYIDSTSLAALGHDINQADIFARQKSLFPVRVLVVHHSPQHRGIFKWLNEIDHGSRQLLDQFCQRHSIHFVLTGHVHDPLVPAPGTPHTYGMELRCGTTLQGAPPRKLPSKSGNVFLLHAIYEDSGSVEWRTDVYQRALQGPFTEATSKRYQVTL